MLMLSYAFDSAGEFNNALDDDVDAAFFLTADARVVRPDWMFFGGVDITRKDS